MDAACFHLGEVGEQTRQELIRAPDEAACGSEQLRVGELGWWRAHGRRAGAERPIVGLTRRRTARGNFIHGNPSRWRIVGERSRSIHSGFWPSVIERSRANTVRDNFEVIRIDGRLATRRLRASTALLKTRRLLRDARRKKPSSTKSNRHDLVASRAIATVAQRPAPLPPSPHDDLHSVV